jgi:hypothetical protein
MRLSAFLIVSTIMAVWAIVSLRKWALQPLDWDIMVLGLGAIGGKLWQRKFESRPPQPPTEGGAL